MSEDIIKKACLLDVFRVGDKYQLSDSYTYRLLTRTIANNSYSLISMGTGEVVFTGSAREILDYLNGDNPIKHPFEYYGNLVKILKESELPGFTQNFAKIVI